MYPKISKEKISFKTISTVLPGKKTGKIFDLTTDS